MQSIDNQSNLVTKLIQKSWIIQAVAAPNVLYHLN